MKVERTESKTKVEQREPFEVTKTIVSEAPLEEEKPPQAEEAIEPNQESAEKTPVQALAEDDRQGE